MLKTNFLMWRENIMNQNVLLATKKDNRTGRAKKDMMLFAMLILEILMELFFISIVHATAISAFKQPLVTIANTAGSLGGGIAAAVIFIRKVFPAIGGEGPILTSIIEFVIPVIFCAMGMTGQLGNIVAGLMG